MGLKFSYLQIKCTLIMLRKGVIYFKASLITFNLIVIRFKKIFKHFETLYLANNLNKDIKVIARENYLEKYLCIV